MDTCINHELFFRGHMEIQSFGERLMSGVSELCLAEFFLLVRACMPIGVALLLGSNVVSSGRIHCEDMSNVHWGWSADHRSAFYIITEGL